MKQPFLTEKITFDNASVWRNTIFQSRYLLCLIILLLMNAESSAKSFAKGQANGHEFDAYSVLPFERNAEITDWFNTVHKTIDYPYNAYFEGLRTPPHQKFSWGKYGHRLFFHWGFNGKPWSPQIQEMVDKCGWSESTIRLFQKKLLEEQARRNTIVMTKTSEMLQLGMSGQLREYTNGFASILYDTHLLGDYSTTLKAPLQDINLILDDLKTALFRKLKGGEEALRINKKLENLKAISDPKIKSLMALELLRKEVPMLILKAQNGYFKKHFQNIGIQLKTY